jgi:periplasmic protein TonB
VTPAATLHPSANDRLKQRFDGTLAAAMLLAVLLHLMLFELWPEMRADRWATAVEEAIDVIRMDEFTLPEAPKATRRPAVPVMSTDVSIEETLPVIGFDEYVELPPPPPADVGTGTGRGIPFTPYTVAPALLNPDEVARALARAYPPALRDSGIGGTVQLLLHIDAEGKMLEARVGTGSGYDRLDAAAIGLADVMRFRPAVNRDRKVAVWIKLPVLFTVR